MEYTREGRAVTYVHYGHEEFDTRRFKGITNFGNVGVKPNGGLWASPVEAESSWKEWCEDQDFRDCREDISFRFTMRNPDKIFYIDSEESFKEFAGRYAQTEEARFGIGDAAVFIDFEKMLRDGWDALEISLTDYGSLYYLMYFWDCDSIVVLNRDAIVPV